MEKTIILKRREDVEAIASYLKENEAPKYLLAYVLAFNTGLRPQELLSLRFSDVYGPDGSVLERIPGTVAYLNEASRNALEEYRQKLGAPLDCNGYLFPSKSGGHITTNTFRKVLKQAAKASGVQGNIGTHTLRKTFGYFHYQANRDIVMLQNIFGHSSKWITASYLDLPLA